MSLMMSMFISGLNGVYKLNDPIVALELLEHVSLVAISDK